MEEEGCGNSGGREFFESEQGKEVKQEKKESEKKKSEHAMKTPQKMQEETSPSIKYEL